jgi:hypothetical protein
VRAAIFSRHAPSSGLAAVTVVVFPQGRRGGGSVSRRDIEPAHTDRMGGARGGSEEGEGEGAGGGGEGRMLRGGGIEVQGSGDAFIRSKHDFSHWIDDQWSKIAGQVGLKPAQFCFEA